MSARPPKKDFQEFYRLYDSLQPRLMSLEVTLQNAAKGGMIGPAEYQARQQLVYQLRQRLLTAHQWVYESQSHPNTDLDFGLPNLESCSYEEVVVCDHFLTQRINLCHSMLSYLASLYQMVEPAAQKKMGSIKSTFTLSKIKKAIDRLSEDGKRVDVDEKVAQEQAVELVTQLKARHILKPDAEVVESLIILFDDLDALTSRIARLKQSTQKEEQHIREMNHWLFENEQKIAQKPAPLPIPTLAVTQDAEREIRSPALNPVAQAEERLAVAREFVENYINLRKREAISQLPDLPGDLKEQAKEKHHAKH